VTTDKTKINTEEVLESELVMFLIRTPVKKLQKTTINCTFWPEKRLGWHHAINPAFEDKDWQERKKECQRNISSYKAALMVHHGECFSLDLCNHWLQFLYAMTEVKLTSLESKSSLWSQSVMWPIGSRIENCNDWIQPNLVLWFCFVVTSLNCFELWD